MLPSITMLLAEPIVMGEFTVPCTMASPAVTPPTPVSPAADRGL